MRFEGNALSVPKGADALLRDLVHERTGLYYDDDRRDQMLDRLASLVMERGFQSYLDYYYLLKYDADGAAEWPRVMDALSVPETYFWREADQFKALAEAMLPQIAARYREGIVRIWSVPCASGEEPLSIAMALEEAGWFSRMPIQIHGSDASEAALAKARAGRYRERAFRALPPELREKYFTPDGDAWVVRPDLCRRVQWSRINLAEDAEVRPMASAPVIFCRNVFIYFSDRSLRATVRILAESMPKGGFLCVGAAESLLQVTNAFELEQVGTAFVYVRQ
jgi:chemotaxis protein methyltransferase CheR